MAQVNFQSLLSDLTDHLLRKESPAQVAAYLDNRFGKLAVSQFEPEHGFSSAQQIFALLGLTIQYENNKPRVLTFNKQFIGKMDNELNSKPFVLAQLRQQGIGFINLGSVVMTTVGLMPDSLTRHGLKAGTVMCSYFFKSLQQHLILEEIIYHHLLDR
ncbi:MAG: hypothetical protein EOO69_07990 [Moraxellaceae bacterium]|nr:MAG: hypothetical protein EOO69_07990 [Moraxellaceae bacterium]